MTPGYMDSSQPCQMRPQGYFCQGCGNNSQHMLMNAPPPCHGSYVHGNFPAYNAYWPPCYPPQVPHHQCCMNHSGFHPPHGAYAPPCYVHPSFPVGYQPWYGSEKNLPGTPVGYHCGNCSPQLCNPKNGGGVVIEEHGPETEKGDQGEAVLPVRSTNWPYPVTWIPHENARNQEQGNSLGSGNHNQPSAEVEAPENMTIQKFPKSWNGCFPFDVSAMNSMVQNQDRNKVQNGKTVELPFDISKLKSLFQGQDAKEGQNKKNREEPGQLPHPIFLIPSHGKREDVEASESKENDNEGRNLESYPSNHLGNEGQTNQKEGKDLISDSNVLSDAEDKSSVRYIPVQNHLQEPKNIPVKLLENHLPKPTEPTKRIAKNVPVKNMKKGQLSSSSKASRLPPVCLRVDPLPKKRNGSSKSPSHPKRKEESITSETKVVSSPLSKKAESKTVPEACDVKCEESDKEMKMSEGSLHAIGTEQESVENNPNLLERSNCEIVKLCEPKESREQPAKKTFTEDDAARMIQTRYRGYDVRRWEPIKKLKEIATIREQMGVVKNRIQALEVSPDQHIEGKEIVVLGEMVMNLLLKVDAVQGLHPSIRDYRKSLARELSSIQEKLDSMKISSAIAEKEAVNEQSIINSQSCISPVNLKHSQVAEENKMVSASSTEKVLVLSPDEHPKSALNRTDEQPNAEAEEGSGLFDTLATAASSTNIPEKMEEGETVVPVNPLSAEGNGMTVTKMEENKTMTDSLKEPVSELPQVLEETLGTSSTQDPGSATGVSEAEVNTSEKEERMEDDDTVLPSAKDVELSELPGGLNDDETCLQDSSSYTHEAQVNAIPEKLDSVKSSCATAEKEAVNERSIINSQTSDSPVDLEHSQVGEENKMVSDSNTEKVLLLSPGEHRMSFLNITDEQPDAEAEEGCGLFEMLATPVSSTTIPEKIEEVETVVPVNPSAADGNGTTETKIEENKAVVESVEEPVNELPQMVEETLETSSTQDPDNATEANTVEKDDKIEENDTVLLSEKDVELSELPAGVNDDETCPQDPSYTHEAQVTAMEPKTASQEETDGYHLPDSSKGIGQETSEPQDEKEQSPETEVIMSEQPPETGPRLVVREQAPETGVVKEQPPETEATKHEIPEETKRLMEENRLFKETMETLVKAGREQFEAISKLTGRVKFLEKKLSRKKRTQTRRRATKPMSGSSIDAIL